MNDTDKRDARQAEQKEEDAELVAKMRECYAFLRSLSMRQTYGMLLRKDTTKEERIFWATLGDIAQYNRSWDEELQERRTKE